MLSAATRPAAFLDYFQDSHGFIHNPAITSPGSSVPLKLMEQVQSSLPSLPCYSQVSRKKESNPDVPSSKRQRRGIGDQAVMEFMQSFRKQRAMASNPVPHFDSKQEMVNNMDFASNQFEDKKSYSSHQVLEGQISSSHNVTNTTSNEFESKKCSKHFSSHQILEGPISSSHKVRDTNDLKQQGNYECQVCHKTFHSGQALGGHKRSHYDGPLIIVKRKAPPPMTTSLMPTSQENSPSKTGCMKLFRDESCQLRDMQEDSQSLASCTKLFERGQLNQLIETQEDKEINLDLTL